MAYKPNTKEDILNDPYFSQSTQGGQYIQQNIDEIFNLAQAGKFYSNAEIRNLSEGLGNPLSFYQGRQTQEEVNAAADASGLAGRKLAEQHNPASQYYTGPSPDGGITGGRAALDAALASGEQPIKTAPTEPGETGGTLSVPGAESQFSGAGTPNENLYIGATNWASLQGQYTPAQLEAATYISNGKRYWNPNVAIESIDKSGKPISSTGVISADTADENVSDVNLGGTSYDLPESETYTAKGQSMADAITEILNSIPDTPEQEQYEDITKKLIDALGAEEGKSAALAEELATPGGYNTLKEQLTESRNTLNTLIAEKNAYNQSLEGQTVSKSRINAKNAYYNSKITLQTSLANALVGNVNQALDEAQNSVAIEFGSQEANIAMYQAQLNALAPLLSSQEKKQSMIQQVLIDEYISGLNAKKEEKTAIYNLAVQATANSGDKKLGDMIAASGSLIDAAALAGDLATSEGWQYVGTPQERDQLISQGYEITQSGGRTYARKPEMSALELYEAKKQIDQKYKTPSGGTNFNKLLSREDLKDFNAAGANLSYGATVQDAIDAGVILTGDTVIGDISEGDKNLIKQALLSQVDDGGMISPDDYDSGKQDWINRGGTGAGFDDEFGERRDPNNQNYNITEESDPLIYSKEWFNKVADTGYGQGLTTDDIYKKMIKNYSEEEMFNKAKEAGYASGWTGKEKDIKRYIESFR